MNRRRFFLSSLGVLALLVIIAAGAFFFAYTKDLYVADPGPVPDLFIHGGMLFDAKSAEPVPNPGILVREGVIACIGRACKATDSAVEIDATNLAILPGLIELHGHFFAPTREDTDRSLPSIIWNFIRIRPDIRRKMLESGVTSFRSVGDPRDAILEVKRLLNSRELAGPRMFVAGPIFTAPGGHPAYGGQDPNRGGFGGATVFQSNDPEVVRREVAQLALQGVDGIKAVLHGAPARDGRSALPTLSLETLRALIDEARKNNLWVAVHVGPTDEIKHAIKAGATTIEHGVRNGSPVDAETLQLLVDNDVVYVPTLGREPQGHLSIPALFEAGVTFGVGTDTNNPEMAFGDSYHQELARMVDAGMPAPEVLLAATRNGAKALQRGDSLGTIEEGKLADMILVAGQPWNDIGDLGSIAAVVQDGFVVFDRP